LRLIGVGVGCFDGINGNHWRREQLLCLSLARLLPSGLCRIHRTSRLQEASATRR
jgi:hypothetical protein